MARISFEDAISTQAQNQSNSTSYGVSYFGLKNDGDTAIVRFMIDSVEEFDILAIHNITVDGKFRKVSCIRDARQPLEACPLCEAGEKLTTKFFIKMVQYVKNENNTFTAVPCIWERSFNYAKTLKNLLEDYGPLSNVLFKVRREGQPGDVSTKYAINYAAPAVYPEAAYPKPTENPFSSFNILGSMVLDKSYEDLAAWVENGRFPSTSNPTANVSAHNSNANFTAAPAAVEENYQHAVDINQVTPRDNYANMRPTPGITPGTEGNSAYIQPRPIRRY